MISFGACKCCAVLQEEVLFLRSLVRPKAPMRYESLPVVTLEADAVISGTSEQIEFSSDEQRRQSEIDSERARILSGEY